MTLQLPQQNVDTLRPYHRHIQIYTVVYLPKTPPTNQHISCCVSLLRQVQRLMGSVLDQSEYLRFDLLTTCGISISPLDGSQTVALFRQGHFSFTRKDADLLLDFFIVQYSVS